LERSSSSSLQDGDKETAERKYLDDVRVGGRPLEAFGRDLLAGLDNKTIIRI